MTSARRQFDELPGWDFSIEEVSASVFRVVASSRHGNRVEITGTDPDRLLERIHDEAVQLDEQMRN